MPKCPNCVHCVTKLILKENKQKKQKFKQAWANQRITFGDVRCKKGMWLKGDMQERVYKRFETVLGDSSQTVKDSVGCPHYVVA